MTKELKVFLWVIALGISLALILKYLFPLMAPFLLGILFACLIEPLVNKLDTRFKVGRRLAVSLILAALIFSVFSLTGLTLVAFYQEAQRLIPKVPELVNRLLGFTQNWLGYLSQFPQVHKILNQFSLSQESMDRLFRSLIIDVVKLLPRFPQILLSIGLGGLTAYFFSRDKQSITDLFYRILPKSWQPATIGIKQELVDSVSRFIRVECSLALMSTLLTTVIFYCIGIPGALVYGFLAGILDFLPVLGPGLIYIPLAAVRLLFGEPYQALWLIIAYFLVLLIRQVTEYKLIGENLNLHPLLSIFVIYIGINIFGFAGIFFGPLLIITLRALYRVLMSLELKKC